MTYLALIIALLVTQIPEMRARVQQDDWFTRLCSRIAAWGIGPAGRLAIVILCPVLLALVVLGALEDFLFGLPWIVLAVVLLVFSFGRLDLHELLSRYGTQCRSGDFEGAFVFAQRELGWVGGSENPDSPEQVHALVQRGFFYEGYQRWFAVFFYFLVLGPVGALAYRLLQLCRHRYAAETVERCLFFLDWVPARLLALAFSLTGDFVRSRQPLLDAVLQTGGQADDLLYAVGTAALEPHAAPGDPAFAEQALAQAEQTVNLLSRSAACWIILISLLVLLD